MEQQRRNSAAQARAMQRLKREHEETYFKYFDEEIARIYEERGELPWETRPDQGQTGD